MSKKKTKEIDTVKIEDQNTQSKLFKSKNIKDLIAPSGIDATNLNNKGIINNESESEINAAGLTNSGTITSSGTINSLTITNETNGTINNEESGKIVADSAFINNGTVVNKSSITVPWNNSNQFCVKSGVPISYL